jgi:hypothetical protein
MYVNRTEGQTEIKEKRRAKDEKNNLKTVEKV